MRLNQDNINLINNLKSKPNYNPRKAKNSILHFGVGNFHRAHQAFFIHEMLNNNKDASIIGIKKSVLISHSFCMPIAIASRVFTLIRGISRLYAIPLAIEEPILKPVYDPGPVLTAITLRVFRERLISLNIDLINKANDSA